MAASRVVTSAADRAAGQQTRTATTSAAETQHDHGHPGRAATGVGAAARAEAGRRYPPAGTMAGPVIAHAP